MLFVLPSAPNKSIGLNGQSTVLAAEVSFVRSSINPAAILGIAAVGTYYSFSAIVVGYTEIY